MAASLMFFGASSLFMKSNVERIAELDFNDRCDRICSIVSDRLDDHARVLASGAALFQTFGGVTREEWRIFNQYQQMEKIEHRHRLNKYLDWRHLNPVPGEFVPMPALRH